MSEILSRMQAVKRYLETDTNNPPQTSEFMAFWKSCSEAERSEFGEQAARNLGVELVTN
jgi:hypothetical protein